MFCVGVSNLFMLIFVFVVLDLDLVLEDYLLFKDFSYSALDLSNISFDEEFSDNLLVTDFESCFNICAG